MAELRYYREEMADPKALEGQQIALVGYGNLGRPAALSLRDAGLKVMIGARPGESARRAEADGLEVVPPEEAIGRAEVVWMALPDEVVPSLLVPEASKRPRSGALIVFSSGYCLANDLLKLPDDVDVALLAPRMIGSKLRAKVESGEGFYAFVSVEHDATGSAEARLLALARAFGALKRPGFIVSATLEAALDTYVEQSVGPLLGAAVLSAFETGVACGLPPEALALELYLSGEMAATWEAFAREGFFAGVRLHGHAASYGGFIRMGDLDTEEMKARFAAVLEDITSGGFAAKFQKELATGSPTRALIEAMTGGDDPLSRAEQTVRRAEGA